MDSKSTKKYRYTISEMFKWNTDRMPMSWSPPPECRRPRNKNFKLVTKTISKSDSEILNKNT